MSNAARAIAFLRDRFEGVAGDILLTALSEPKEADVGRRREYRLKRPVDVEHLAQIIAKEDRPNRALFVCVGTIKPDAVRSPKGFYRTKANILQLPGLHSDIDFKHLKLPAALNPTAEVTRQLIRSPWKPAPIVITGGGVHAYWRTARPIEPSDFDQAETAMRALARHFGGDPAVAEVSRLMRLPGTSNWKYGEPRRCLVSLHGCALIDIWDEEVGAGEPLLTWGSPALPAPLGQLRQATNAINAFEAYAAEHATPLDPGGRLAEMEWHGAGESGVHQTQLSVTAALLNAGVPRDEVIEQVLQATMTKPFAQGWNARAEARTIAGMVDSFAAKLAAEGRPNGPTHVNGSGEAKLTPGTAKAKAEPAEDDFDIPWADIDEHAIPLRAWVFGTLLRGFVEVLVGGSGTSKSNLIIMETLAMISGEGFARARSEEHLNVWYHGEDPQEELERRFAAAMRHYGLSRDYCRQHLKISGAEVKLSLAHMQFNKFQRNEKTISRIKRVIQQSKIDVFIVDPLIEMHDIAENINEMMHAVARILCEIARQTGCAILVVHHPRKANGATEITIEDARGASSVVAAARSARVLNVMTEREAETLGIPLPQRKEYFKVEYGKSSMRRMPSDADWYRTIEVFIENGLGWTPGDGAGVVTTWERPGVFGDITEAQIAAAMAAVRASECRASDKSPDWVGYVIAEALGIAPGNTHKLREVVRQWLLNGRLKEVRRKDSKRMTRDYVEAVG